MDKSAKLSELISRHPDLYGNLQTLSVADLYAMVEVLNNYTARDVRTDAIRRFELAKFVLNVKLVTILGWDNDYLLDYQSFLDSPYI